ncbi:Pectinesterase/pectinesterase inhibitor PPE8B [Morella rubra]|uniref:Pectinesterase/pectinesterase inhibitor PPE8B n=1 Tax=Morella rubra TaxID=262757 RepID=A0A6A1ULZ5_9ROSI|nr:Pectinesterase/pectinesterase inhibitor PPE8B [Morella rubra]
MGCCASKEGDSKACRVARWRSTGIVALRDCKLKANFLSCCNVICILLRGVPELPNSGQKGSAESEEHRNRSGSQRPKPTTGFSIQFCNISADSDVAASLNSTATYLGRPWKPYSRTVIMQSYMSNVIRSEGWLEWNGSLHLDSLFYGEYMNYGPGAGLGSRVKWPGYHLFNNSSEANNFTVAQFIEGNLWLPSTGVRYTAGLGV